MTVETIAPAYTHHLRTNVVVHLVGFYTNTGCVWCNLLNWTMPMQFSKWNRSTEAMQSCYQPNIISMLLFVSVMAFFFFRVLCAKHTLLNLQRNCVTCCCKENQDSHWLLEMSYALEFLKDKSLLCWILQHSNSTISFS